MRQKGFLIGCCVDTTTRSVLGPRDFTISSYILFTGTVTTAFDSRAQCPSRLNVSAGASVSSDSHGFGPRNCLSGSDSSWLKPRANQKKIQTSLQSLAEALVGLLLLVSSTLAAGDAWTDFSSERFHWRFMVFQGFSGSIPCSPSTIIVRHSPGVSLGASPGVGEPSSVSNYGCDGCDRFINSDLFTCCWCFLSFPSSPACVYTLCACQGFRRYPSSWTSYYPSARTTTHLLVFLFWGAQVAAKQESKA